MLSITAGPDSPPPTGWPARDDPLRRRVTSRRCLHRAPGSVWACGRRAVGRTERCGDHLGDLADLADLERGTDPGRPS